MNIEQKAVLIAQVGWAGIKIGKIDYFFQSKKCYKKHFWGSFSVKIADFSTVLFWR